MSNKYGTIEINGRRFKLMELPESFSYTRTVAAEPELPAPIILVPEEIGVIKVVNDDELYSLALLFNDNKQMLNYNHEAGVYDVSGLYYDITPSRAKYCKLTPCKREDLKPGDLAYREQYKDNKVNNLGSYCIILNDKELVAVDSDRNAWVEEEPYNHWYKVEEL